MLYGIQGHHHRIPSTGLEVIQRFIFAGFTEGSCFATLLFPERILSRQNIPHFLIDFIRILACFEAMQGFLKTVTQLHPGRFR